MNPPPSYQELAELLVLLVENNICNLHRLPDRPDWLFVACKSNSGIPVDWQHAIRCRQSLIDNNLVIRKDT